MLTSKEIEIIKDALITSKRPFFIFDDDPDGLCSFLLLYRMINEGKGMILKSRPLITQSFAQKVKDYDADKTFILDVADVEQDFIDTVGTPVIWIDHHSPQKKHRVTYLNPQKKGDFVPTTYMAYQVTQQDVWIATIGCVADWVLPDFLPEFEKQFPGIIDQPYKTAPDLLFKTKLGVLIRVFSFNLKGPTREAMKSVKIFTRIQHPDEILKQTTPQGKFLWKRYQVINQKYEALKKHALKTGVAEKGLFLFTYTSDHMSLTSDLSNELSTLLPQKVIILAREKSGDMKCSIRSHQDGPDVKKILEKALGGIHGYGGGHEHACGANIPKNEFKAFLQQFREQL